MSGAVLLRWSGLALIVGAVANLGFLVTLGAVGGPEAPPENILTGTWALSHGLHIIGAELMLLGVVGLFVRQLSKMNLLGLVGFLLAFVGLALFVGQGMIAEFLVPPLAAADPQLQQRLFSDPLVAASFLLTFIPLNLGLLLFGIFIYRAAMLPKWSGILMAVAGLILGLPLPGPAVLVGGVILTAAAVWQGYVLWSERPAMAVAA